MDELILNKGLCLLQGVLAQMFRPFKTEAADNHRQSVLPG